MRRVGLLALPLAFATLAACEILGLTTPAAQACAAPARGYAGTVVGSFNTTVGAIRGLEPLPTEPAWPAIETRFPSERPDASHYILWCVAATG